MNPYFAMLEDQNRFDLSLISFSAHHSFVASRDRFYWINFDLLCTFRDTIVVIILLSLYQLWSLVYIQSYNSFVIIISFPFVSVPPLKVKLNKVLTNQSISNQSSLMLILWIFWIRWFVEKTNFHCNNGRKFFNAIFTQNWNMKRNWFPSTFHKMNSFEMLANWLYQVLIKSTKKKLMAKKWKSDPCSGLDSECVSNVGELPDG